MKLFSEYFNIDLSGREKWHDPIVGYDIKLFIDPFLVDKKGKSIKEFKNAHEKVLNFFNEAFIEAAGLTSRDKKTCAPLLRSLTFPEVHELYLGYSKDGNSGAGSGKGFATVLLNSMFNLIDNGIESISRFEELELFGEGFGADRIGDMMANLLKPELIAFTHRMCKEYKQIRMSPTAIRNYEHVRGRVWDSSNQQLPFIKHSSLGKRSVILVPKCFLRDLPTVDVQDFWDYSYANENDEVRSQFGEDIKKGVDKDTMFEAARNAELRRKYLASLDGQEAIPYDIDDDPQLFRKWYPLGKEIVKNIPLKIENTSTQDAFNKSVLEIINKFKHYIEERKGSEVIREEKTKKGRREPVVQRLFDGVIRAYAESNDIDLSPEVNVGTGPVDFKFSHGYTFRALLEVKLARNSRWLSGLKTQLPTYMKSEGVQKGIFCIVMYEENELAKINDLRTEAQNIKNDLGFDIDIVTVDAQIQKSASKR